MKHVHTPPVPPIEELVDERLARVVEHPDGWYWVAPDGHQQFGPFESMEAVLADMDIADAGPDAGQTLAETERVMGLADWIDPETGTLAEDTPVRLEDH
jgi:hypothetical protein